MTHGIDGKIEELRHKQQRMIDDSRARRIDFDLKRKIQNRLHTVFDNINLPRESWIANISDGEALESQYKSCSDFVPRAKGKDGEVALRKTKIIKTRSDGSKEPEEITYTLLIRPDKDSEVIEEYCESQYGVIRYFDEEIETAQRLNYDVGYDDEVIAELEHLAVALGREVPQMPQLEAASA